MNENDLNLLLENGLITPTEYDKLYEMNIKIQALDTMDEWLKTNPEVENRPVMDVYAEYRIWCLKRKKPMINAIAFGRKIKQKLGFISKTKTLYGTSVRVYIKEKEVDGNGFENR